MTIYGITELRIMKEISIYILEKYSRNISKPVTFHIIPYNMFHKLEYKFIHSIFFLGHAVNYRGCAVNYVDCAHSISSLLHSFSDR